MIRKSLRALLPGSVWPVPGSVWTALRLVLPALGAVLPALGAVWLAPDVASAAGTNDAGYFTPERLRAVGTGIVGLVSVILGVLSLARRRGRFGSGTGRRGAFISAAAALVCIALAVLHLATTSGGFGTGNGRAGAIVAMVVGLIGLALSGFVLARSGKAR